MADVATKEDLRQMELRLEARMEGLRGELKAHTLRSIVAVNVPTILATFGLGLTAARFG